MEIQFNKERCILLLKQRKSLQQKGELLSNYDPVKNDELINYLTILEDQIFWKSRFDYLKLLNLLVNNKISLDQFFNEFCSLRNSNLRSVQILKRKLEEEAGNNSSQVDINFTVESDGFTALVSYLHSLIDIWNPDVTLETNLKYPELFTYGISEEYLRLIIEDDFLPKFKKYCN